GIARVSIGRIHRFGRVNFPVRGVVGSKVNIRSRDDIQHAVMIKVRGRGAPRVIEVVQLLHSEFTGDDVRRALGHGGVFVSQVFELNLTGAAHVERERTVASGLGIGGAGYF